MNTEVMTVEDAARFLNVSSKQVVYRLRRDHGLPAKQYGRRLLFLRDEIMIWLRNQPLAVDAIEQRKSSEISNN